MQSYPLPARLGLSAAAPMARELAALRGQPLTLDARGLTHVATPGLQVLLSARKTWEADGQPLLLAGTTPAHADQLATLGLSPDDLGQPAPAAPSEAPHVAGTEGDDSTRSEP